MKLVSGIVGLVCLVAAGDAHADTKLQCQMSGTYVESNDNFAFVASYIARPGSDTFVGVYQNPSAGATANVEGSASGGAWMIVVTYTDAKHRGMVKKLIGMGQREANNTIKVSGKYTEDLSGKPASKGSFTLVGKCT